MLPVAKCHTTLELLMPMPLQAACTESVTSCNVDTRAPLQHYLWCLVKAAFINAHYVCHTLHSDEHVSTSNQIAARHASTASKIAVHAMMTAARPDRL
jgi:hypothetical protein